MKLLVVLTQYKRNHLEKQLCAINNQTIKPDYLVVFQNESHVDIIHLTGIFYPPSLILYIINYFFFKKKVIWSPRGELANEALIYSSKIKYFYLLIIKFFLSNKCYLHTTSNDETLLVKNKLNHSTIIQIPNYIKPENKLASENKFEYLLFI